MQYTYIFDTSALKSAKGVKVKEISKREQIALSPISIYELVCHLDETKNGEDTFARQKGYLRKCKLFEILHEPFANCATTIGISGAVNPTRFEEPHVLTQLIEQLEESKTLEEFYSKEVTFPNEDIGQIRDVAANARKTFGEENNRYIKHMNTLHQIIEKIGGYGNIDAKAFVKICGSGAASFFDNVDKLLAAKVFVSTYAYIGYKLARLLEYQGNNIPKNDTEDSFICLHLNLVEPIALVTNDRGTIDALKVAFNAYRKAEGNEGDSTLLARVIRLEDFYKEVLVI